jgi:hypothetical protein
VIMEILLVIDTFLSPKFLAIRRIILATMCRMAVSYTVPSQMVVRDFFPGVSSDS